MPTQAANSFSEIASSTIYLMGSSFILGSLFTLLLLALLDLMHTLKNKNTGERS